MLKYGRLPINNVVILEWSNNGVAHDWVIKGHGMSSRVCVTGHIKDPMPLKRVGHRVLVVGFLLVSFIN